MRTTPSTLSASTGLRAKFRRYCRALVGLVALHRSIWSAADLLGLVRRSFFAGTSSRGCCWEEIE